MPLVRRGVVSVLVSRDPADTMRQLLTRGSGDQSSRATSSLQVLVSIPLMMLIVASEAFLWARLQLGAPSVMTAFAPLLILQVSKTERNEKPKTKTKNKEEGSRPLRILQAALAQPRSRAAKRHRVCVASIAEGWRVAREDDKPARERVTTAPPPRRTHCVPRSLLLLLLLLPSFPRGARRAHARAHQVAERRGVRRARCVRAACVCCCSFRPTSATSSTTCPGPPVVQPRCLARRAHPHHDTTSQATASSRWSTTCCSRSRRSRSRSSSRCSPRSSSTTPRPPRRRRCRGRPVTRPVFCSHACCLVGRGRAMR